MKIKVRRNGKVRYEIEVNTKSALVELFKRLHAGDPLRAENECDRHLFLRDHVRGVTDGYANDHAGGPCVLRTEYNESAILATDCDEPGAEPFVLVELVGWGPPRDAEKLVNQLVEYLAEQGFEPVPVLRPLVQPADTTAPTVPDDATEVECVRSPVIEPSEDGFDSSPTKLREIFKGETWLISFLDEKTKKTKKAKKPEPAPKICPHCGVNKAVTLRGLCRTCNGLGG